MCLGVSAYALSFFIISSFFGPVFFFPRSFRLRIPSSAVCLFLNRGIVFRTDDAFQQRFSWFSDWIQAVQRSVLCRSRRELSHEYLLATFGFDTAENGSSKVWRYGLWTPLPTHTHTHLSGVNRRNKFKEANE